MPSGSELPETIWKRFSHWAFGNPRDPHEPGLEQKLALIAILAWVGLGVDGLSSSAYGPEEAFRSLGSHAYLAFFLALATAFTICIISYAYSRLIEHFPHGGGGYVVATHLLGKPAGVVSGCALLVDYVLTITVSIASGGDAVFSLLPPTLALFKLPLEFAAILFLISMNLRGVRESVRPLVPFVLLFVATHLIMILGGIGMHMHDFPSLFAQTHQEIHHDVHALGKWGLFLIFLRAYSLGGGTYTGIEAVSNGVGTMREPRVATGKRTMIYLALSLAVTASGLLLCYMLFKVQPAPGQTLNAVLARAFAGGFEIGGIPIGEGFIWVTLFSESILLLVAAQTGFIDGPRVMANMSLDSWLPKRFASLSDRLTMQNGVILMGVSAILTLFFTRGQIGILVVMYSINVFITFSLSEIAMMKFWVTSRKEQKLWKRNLLIHATGFVLCFSILWVMIIEKFADGAWATLGITAVLIALCTAIRRHYGAVAKRVGNIDEKLKELLQGKPEAAIHSASGALPAFDSTKPTAAILIGGYGRLGRHNLLTILRYFPHTFHNVIFVSVGVVNSEFFKHGDVRELENDTEANLKEYVAMANHLGLPARYKFAVGMDVAREASQLCVQIAKENPRAMFFAGELVFDRPHWLLHFLHNETAYAIQRQIRYAGLPMVILPMVLQPMRSGDVEK